MPAGPCKLCQPWQYDTLPFCRPVAEGSGKEIAEDGLIMLSITMCWLPRAHHALHLEVQTCQEKGVPVSAASWSFSALH